MKTARFLLFILISGTACINPKPLNVQKPQQLINRKVIVAYVTSWTSVMPDPTYITHINYAFGHVNNTFNGIKIDNEGRLKSLVSLKSNFPNLKILISIGGWGSGRFSEMAALEENRNKFAEDCLQVINDYNLDGIDIDWEYPTSKAAKISSSPNDTQNYTLMMKAIRDKIGQNKLLTLATSADARYIDFKAIEPTVNFVNIMAYDMGNPPYHNAGLYRSAYTSGISVDEAVTAHVNAGMPINKLVLGIPFYGHGNNGIASFIDYKEIIKLKDFKKQWDAQAKVPFLENDEGEFVCSYESPESIEIKCEYLLNRGMLGAMYWEYAGDTKEGDLRKAVYNGVYK